MIIIAIQLLSSFDLTFEQIKLAIADVFPESEFITDQEGVGIVTVKLAQDALTKAQREWLCNSPFSGSYIDSYTVQPVAVPMGKQLPQTLDALADEVFSVNDAYYETDGKESTEMWRDRVAQTQLLVHLEIAKQLARIATQLEDGTTGIVNVNEA